MYALAVTGVLLAGVVLPAKAYDSGHSVGETVFGGVSGLLFLAAGAVAHHRRPDNRVGLLMVLVGLGFFAEDVRFVPWPLPYTLGLLLGMASSGFVAHLVLAFPTGRLESRASRFLAAGAYLVVFGFGPLGVLFVDPAAHGQSYPPNLLLIDPSPTPLSLVRSLVFGSGSVLAAGVVVVLVRRWQAATRPRRRILAPVFGTGLVGSVASACASLGELDVARVVLLTTYRVAFCLLPLAFLAGVLRVELARSGVGGLLIDLRQALSPAELRDRLAVALGDPSLRVGYWRPDAAGLVDAEGVALTLPAPGSGQLVTWVDRNGRRVAGLVHDAALAEEGHLLRAVASAAGLALDNQRLTAEVRAQLAEVRASRARIVAAVTEERRRMERDLHDGVQQSVVGAAIGLRVATGRLGPDVDPEVRALLAACGDGLDAALADLRALSRGLHPAVLTDEGLVAALEALVERSPVAVELTATAVPRLPPVVESTAYLVVAEALTNAMKHARADRILIAVDHAEDGPLRVVVTDDGVGGATIADGGGLAGLTDRVRALDGDLVVASRTGRGTRVTAVLPGATR